MPTRGRAGRRCISRPSLVALALWAGAACGGDDGTAGAGAAGSGATVVASCRDWGQRQVGDCPSDGTDLAAEIADCERRRADLAAIGCEKAYAEAIHCWTHAADWDCESGSASCGGSEIYGRCVSAFAQRTGCSHMMGRDDECPAGTFYFFCLNAAPASCSVLGPAALGENACCPSFATDTAGYFE